MAALIAVINDNEDIVQLIGTILEGEGYQVVVQIQAEDPYHMVLREKPNLIILDIHLTTPEDGHEILQLLTLNPATAGTPIILCTGDVRYIREKGDFLAVKGVAVLEKPFDIEALLVCVAACLAAKRHDADHVGSA